jgi:hypothetical protein
METLAFQDKQMLSLPTDQAANAMYVFFPGAPAEISTDLVKEIVRTGFFISLRVLPRHNFGKYLIPRHSDYPSLVTFDVLYRELLQVYDLIFPLSAVITPFTEEYFRVTFSFTVCCYTGN